MKTRTMTRTQAELLLAAVIIARSTSYVLTKVGLQDMGKFTLLAVRFLLALAFLAVLFWRRLLQIDRRTLLSGLAMGGIYFCVMTAELTALKTVETSTVSFVTNTAVVIVPLVQAVLSCRWPEHRVLLGALACLLGVALLTLRNGLVLTPGVGYCILEAFLYSAAILVTDRLTHAGADPLLSGVVQVGFLGVLALIASFLFETPHLPGSGTEWLVVLALALVCSGFGFTLQPVAQSGTTADHAALFCALNPFVAATLGAVCFHEHFGLAGLLGGALILAGSWCPVGRKSTTPEIQNSPDHASGEFCGLCVLRLVGTHVGHERVDSLLDAELAAVDNEVIPARIAPLRVAVVVVVGFAVAVDTAHFLRRLIGREGFFLHEPPALHVGLSGDEQVHGVRVGAQQIIRAPAEHDERLAAVGKLLNVLERLVCERILRRVEVLADAARPQQVHRLLVIARGVLGVKDAGQQQLLIIKRDAELFGDLFGDVLAAAAVFTADGHDDLLHDALPPFSK